MPGEGTMLRKRDKFNLLWWNHSKTFCSGLDEVAFGIYQLGRRRGRGFIASQPGPALATQLAPTGHLSDHTIEVICEYFQVPAWIWDIDDKHRFCEAVANALREKRNLARDPPTWLDVGGNSRWDFWSLSNAGQKVGFAIRRAAQDALGRVDATSLPTFQRGALVVLEIAIEFPAELRIFHISPERSARLIAPSLFVPEGHIEEGRHILPTAAPPEHPLAFAAHDPIGVHYVIAVAVREGTKISLPEPAEDLDLRQVTDDELDRLTQRLGEVGNPDLFGVAKLSYQV